MRYPALSWLTIVVPLLTISSTASAESPQEILARAVKALGGEENLSRARAVRVKLKGTFYDPGMKESLVEGVRFRGELITQLPRQEKLALQVDTAAGLLRETRVLNGHEGWIRDNDEIEVEKGARLADSQQSAYVDYVSSLVPLVKDKGYTLSSLGEAQVEGRPAVGIKVVSAGHPDVALYFDKDSGFLVKSEHHRRDPSTNRNVRWEEFFSAYQEVNPAQREEQTLSDAKLSSSTAAILEWLRKQTLSEEVRNKIKALIRGLGDASFPARQKAKEDLLAQGSTAVPLLTQALKDPDPEVAGLAKECLQKIGKGRDPAVLLAAIRLLAMRKPAGASRVLQDYLPSAPDDTVAQEVRAALAAVGSADGKSGPAQEIPGQRLLLPGFKRPTKGMVKQDGKKTAEYELSDYQIFNKLHDSVFAKP
jgi:hypothetical protein